MGTKVMVTKVMGTEETYASAAFLCDVPVYEFAARGQGASNGGSQARRTVMVDRSDLIHKANELRQPAELEANEDILRGLMRTADHYAHLAESKAQSEAHPPSAASLGDVFIKGS